MNKNMENYILSFDVSTTNVGIALWDINGNLLELKHLALKANKDIEAEYRDLQKADLFKEYCVNYKNKIENDLNGKIKHIFIEAPLANTSININTTSLLLGFNGIVRYILYGIYGVMPQKISVHNSRKLFCPELVKTEKKKNKIVEVLSFPPKYKKDKKLYIWEKVAKLEPQIEWFYTRNNTLKTMCFDMSDSYAVGFAGLKLLGII